MKTVKPNLLPNITSYLENIDYNLPISLDDIQNIIYIISSYTGLKKDTISIIVSLYFLEIRNELIKNKSVQIQNFGLFKNNNGIHFKASKILKNKIKE